MSGLSVYVATADHGLVKIGYSSNPSLRRSSLGYQEGMPVSIERAWRATLAERIDAIMGRDQRRGEYIRQAVLERLERDEAERGIKPKTTKKARRKPSKG